jgi:hypothetical protein
MHAPQAAVALHRCPVSVLLHAPTPHPYTPVRPYTVGLPCIISAFYLQFIYAGVCFQEPEGQLRLLGLRSACSNESSSRSHDSSNRNSWKLLWATCGTGECWAPRCDGTTDAAWSLLALSTGWTAVTQHSLLFPLQPRHLGSVCARISMVERTGR